MTGGNACISMHTALRKVCDSHITSAAYNFITLIDVKPIALDPWRIFGRLVAQKIVQDPKRLPTLILQEAHRELEDELHRVVDSHLKINSTQPKNLTLIFNTLNCIFKCFTQADWDCMAAYLSERT